MVELVKDIVVAVPERTQSVAVRLIFQSDEQTLTDEEVNKVLDTIYSTLLLNGGVMPRTGAIKIKI